MGPGVEVAGCIAAWTEATLGNASRGLADPGIHGMVIAPGQPTRVLTSTPREIFVSTDVGESWQRLHIAQHFLLACRWIAVSPMTPR